LKKYEPMRLSVPTYLFVPDDASNDKGWRTLLGDNFHIEKVEGTHTSMIQRPHARILGQAMSRALNAAEKINEDRHSSEAPAHLSKKHPGATHPGLRSRPNPV
jgi:hypothetical protein